MILFIVFLILHPKVKELHRMSSIQSTELSDPNRLRQGSFELSQQQRESIICSESLFDQSLLQSTEVSNELFNFSDWLIENAGSKSTYMQLLDYIRQAVIPWGLSWQREPMLSKKTEDFCGRWCDLMTQLKKDTNELDKSIDEKKTISTPNNQKWRKVQWHFQG